MSWLMTWPLALLPSIFGEPSNAGVDLKLARWPQLPPITQQSSKQDKMFAPYYDHFLMRYCVLRTVLMESPHVQVVFRNVFSEDVGTPYADKPNLEYNYATTEWEPVDQPKAQTMIAFMINNLHLLASEFPNQTKKVAKLTSATTPGHYEVWAANNGETGWNGRVAGGSHSAGEVAGSMVKEKFGFVVVPRPGDTPETLGGLINYADHSYNETIRQQTILDTCRCVASIFERMGERIPQDELQVSCGILPPAVYGAEKIFQQIFQHIPASTSTSTGSITVVAVVFVLATVVVATLSSASASTINMGMDMVWIQRNTRRNQGVLSHTLLS